MQAEHIFERIDFIAIIKIKSVWIDERNAKKRHTLQYFESTLSSLQLKQFGRCSQVQAAFWETGHICLSHWVSGKDFLIPLKIYRHDKLYHTVYTIYSIPKIWYHWEQILCLSCSYYIEKLNTTHR